MVSVFTKNIQAMEALNRDDIGLAQEILRTNLREHPCRITYHNLGVFYMQYGMRLSSGRFRSAAKLGLRYLIKAINFDDDAQCFTSTATALLNISSQKEDLITAYNFFRAAYALQPNPITKYNIGVCLFRQERFSEAATIFQELCSHSNISLITSEQGENPQIALANCFWFLHDSTACLSQLSQVKYCGAFDSRPSVFSLYTLCGAYEQAMLEYYELLNEWMPTNTVLAALSCCLHNLPEYTSLVMELLPDHQLQLLQKLLCDRDLTFSILQSYSYTLPIIDMYGFALE